MKLLRRLPRAENGRPSRFGITTRSFEPAESTFESLRWQRARGAQVRWSLWGAVFGAMLAAIVFAPAAWLAGWVARATRRRPR